MSSTPTVTPLSPAKTPPTPKPYSVSNSTSLQHLQQLHALAIKSNLQTHLPFLTNLVTQLTSNPTPCSLSYARQLFDQIPDPPALLFNTLARGYSRSPTPFQAFSLFADMLSSGVSPDNYTFPSLLKACANAKALESGKQAHACALKLGLADSVFFRPTLINMYAECGELRSARVLFDRGDGECVISYNSMITACVRSNRPGEALALFRELQGNGMRPTDVTMLSALSACALLGALELGKWIHEYVKKNGFGSYVKVNTALIDMYAKCGSLEDAVDVFHSMGSKDTHAWSAMIVAYAIHGHRITAISLFDKMLKSGIKPDGITFLGLLYACSHSGMVDKGLDFFRSMKTDHLIVPGIKHYGCIVDLLARAGRLDEAYSFIDTLPIKPTPILWRTLLSACGGHGNVDLGQLVFERILELDDSHGGDYVILSNMCASAGRWDDVNQIRKMMSSRGIVKVPGVSSIELENAVHEFFSGDGKHPMSREAHWMVDEVVEQLKAVAGYVPDTSKVVHVGLDEEGKEISVRYHSEKLAIAFGLMNSPPGATIRVVKNLRVCGDCHSMAKMVSKVFERRIVLRDLNRFHHFEDGLCSSNNYW
nr:pentatricopeptide repeat protein AaPPR15 [Agave angustifolia]